MAVARKKKRTLKPRTPSRVKRRKRKIRSAHHPELYGLGLVAFGLFLGVVLYGGWNGGIVGGKIADGTRGLLGAAAYVAPIACVAVGSLMVARNALVDVRPFRTGLAVFSLGLIVTLSSAHGGLLGELLGGGLESLLGPGATILGVFCLVVGTLLLSGASAGAILRRSGHAMRTAAKKRPRRDVARAARVPEPLPSPSHPRRSTSRRSTPCTTFRTSSRTSRSRCSSPWPTTPTRARSSTCARSSTTRSTTCPTAACSAARRCWARSTTRPPSASAKRSSRR